MELIGENGAYYVCPCGATSSTNEVSVGKDTEKKPRTTAKTKKKKGA